MTKVHIEISKEEVDKALREIRRRERPVPQDPPPTVALPDEDELQREREIRDEVDRLEFGPPDSALAREAERIRIRREAIRILDRQEAERQFRAPPSGGTLAELLEEDQEPLAFSVYDLHPRGANTLLGASFKAGKTTLLLSLMKSLLDGERFLDLYSVDPAEGRVAFWNYEMDKRQFRAWARNLDIKNPGRGCQLPLRCEVLDLLTPVAEDWAVRWLQENQVSTWIIDPFARAYRGEENSNSDVAHWLETLDVIKRRAGVADLFIATHFGRGDQKRGEERSRGATRLDDWADVRWTLVKDRDRRYFSANGRDVSVTEMGLDYNEATGWLSAKGLSRDDEDRAAKAAKFNELVECAYQVCVKSPGIGGEALRDQMSGGRAQERAQAISMAIEQGWIRREREGRKTAHYADPAKHDEPYLG